MVIDLTTGHLIVVLLNVVQKHHVYVVANSVNRNGKRQRCESYPLYSYRKATMGSTRAARRAGT
jgi:hypothetical protein